MDQPTRRDALKIAASAVAAAAVPLSATAVAAEAAPMFDKTMFAYVVGTPGEHDAQFIRAATPREAFLEWGQYQGWYDPDEGCENCEKLPCECDVDYCTTHVKKWDKLEGEPSGGQWLDAGFGYLCHRCDYEIGSGADGYNMDGDAVCMECMTLADWQKADPEHYDELIDEALTAEYGPDLRFPEYWT